MKILSIVIIVVFLCISGVAFATPEIINEYWNKDLIPQTQKSGSATIQLLDAGYGASTDVQITICSSNPFSHETYWMSIGKLTFPMKRNKDRNIISCQFPRMEAERVIEEMYKRKTVVDLVEHDGKELPRKWVIKE